LLDFFVWYLIWPVRMDDGNGNGTVFRAVVKRSFSETKGVCSYVSTLMIKSICETRGVCMKVWESELYIEGEVRSPLYRRTWDITVSVWCGALSGFVEGHVYGARCPEVCSSGSRLTVVDVVFQVVHLKSMDVLSTCHYGIDLMTGLEQYYSTIN